MNILPDDYLKKEYELRVSYLKDHFSRMWTRFNFFLTITTGLFVFTLNQNSRELVLLAGIMGVLVSLVWNHFAATDNYLADVYKRQIAHAHFLMIQDARFEALRATQLSNELKVWTHTGAVSTEYFDPADGLVKRIPQGFFQRRISRISATELGVVLSLLYALAWIGLLIVKI